MSYVTLESNPVNGKPITISLEIDGEKLVALTASDSEGDYDVCLKLTRPSEEKKMNRCCCIIDGVMVCQDLSGPCPPCGK